MQNVWSHQKTLQDFIMYCLKGSLGLLALQQHESFLAITRKLDVFGINSSNRSNVVMCYI